MIFCCMQRSRHIDCFVRLVTFSWAAAACAAPLTAVMKGELLEREALWKINSVLYRRGELCHRCEQASLLAVYHSLCYALVNHRCETFAYLHLTRPKHYMKSFSFTSTNHWATSTCNFNLEVRLRSLDVALTAMVPLALLIHCSS